jgi:drug/metabolite transporter (DMT)-like permease
LFEEIVVAMQTLGVVAGIATAFCWAISPLVFTAAAKVYGPVVVNRIRLLIAVVLLWLLHTILFGSPVPVNVTWDHWMWLSLSGIVGLTLGDLVMFHSYVRVGPRLGTLLMAISPVMSTLLAWLFLGERLRPAEIFGICVTVAGIAWVVMERQHPTQEQQPRDRRDYLIGVLCGLGGALGQAGGLILSKKGLSGNFNPMSSVVIRMTAATAAMWLITLFSGQVRATFTTVRTDLKVLPLLLVGVLVGPIIGIWLSMISVQNIPVGIASTLMALTPIILLPFSRFAFHEKVSLRAVAGTFVSIAGVVILYML